MFGFPLKDSSAKVCIIGINLSNIILAQKLSSLGIEVKTIDANQDKIEKYKKGEIPDLVKQGIFLVGEKELKYFDKNLSSNVF